LFDQKVEGRLKATFRAFPFSGSPGYLSDVFLGLVFDTFWELTFNNLVQRPDNLRGHINYVNGTCTRFGTLIALGGLSRSLFCLCGSGIYFALAFFVGSLLLLCSKIGQNNGQRL
jgi:hypothetical protein